MQTKPPASALSCSAVSPKIMIIKLKLADENKSIYIFDGICRSAVNHRAMPYEEIGGYLPPLFRHVTQDTWHFVVDYLASKYLC